MYPQTQTASQTQVQAFFNRVYNWMGAGLLLTAAVAWFTANNFALLSFVAGSFLFLFLAQLALVFALGAMLPRLSVAAATAMFFVYAFLNGLTLSGIFLAYTSTSIAAVFAVSAGMFVGLSAYGYLTKRDLSPLGRALIMALIGLVLAMLVNLFLRSGMLSFLLSLGGVVIFSALTAYDTQKLKNMAQAGFADGQMGEKVAIYGALALYLDFINLFLNLLRLFGVRR